MRTVSRPLIPVAGSKRARRASPESTTTRTPSIVRLVSAMLVASTILRCCASPGRNRCVLFCRRQIAEQRQHAHAARQTAFFELLLRAADLRLSRQERQDVARFLFERLRDRSRGSRSDVDLALATRSQRRRPPSASRLETLVLPRLRPAHCRAAARRRAASSVADITRMRRSSRTSACASRHSARPRSALRLRSWNSSKITIATPSSVASRCSQRVRIPSVTTSMRVLLLVRDSSRVRKPTVWPTASPSICAMRVATARAARRRGSSITILPLTERLRRPAMPAGRRSTCRRRAAPATRRSRAPATAARSDGSAASIGRDS